MKRLLLLAILIGSLFTIPNSFAQSSKPKRATIKYEDGGKYVGEIGKVNPKFFNGKAKIKHGKGIMYFANGDQLDGEWYNDQCKRGTYKFANGDVFEGEISVIYTQRGMMGPGTMIFASEGTIMLGYKAWHYPANCNFTGTIKYKKPYTGTFDCTLTTEDGDRFTGKLSDGHFGSGKIEYANGDTFEGDFTSDAPSSGKYRYGSVTEITRAKHKWEIPAGCVFEGNIVPFTGTVNMGITNEAGDKFVGKLNNGAPDEGTMVFASTGHTETGKWKDGLSPRAYEIKQRQEEERRQQEEREAQRRAQIYDRKCLQAFEAHVNKYITKEMAENIWNTCQLSITCGKFANRDAEELIHGASIKLAQLYVNKKVTYSETGDDIYTCTSVNHIANSDNFEYIVMTLKPDRGGQIKTLYLTNVRVSKSPQLTVFLPIKYPYPNTLPYVYYRCEAVEAKGGESSGFNPLISLVNDNAQNAASRAQDYWIRRFGPDYGTAVFNREIKLGMTVEMVQIIKGSKGNVSRNKSYGQEIIRLSYGGFSSFWGTVSSSSSSYTFVNNRLTEISEY